MKRQNQAESTNSQNRQKKIMEHMGLVRCILQRIEGQIPKEMPLEDALQYGCIGLIQAIDRYEEQKGKFSTYAGIYVYRSIMEGALAFRGRKRQKRKDPQGIDRRIAEKISLWEVLQKNDADTEGTLEQVEEQCDLERALQKLKPDERQVIDECYYGQFSWQSYAQKHRVGTEWVCLLHRRALKKLRKWMCVE